MKKISIRELHRRTGVWVRNARKYGEIVVSDRNIPVAKLIPITEETPANRFLKWKALKRFAPALDRPVGGPAIEEIISEDRNR